MKPTLSGILSALFFGTLTTGCHTFVNMAKTSPPYGYNEATGKFPDTPENRKYFLHFIETDLIAESKMSKAEQLNTVNSWTHRLKSFKKTDENLEFLH